MNQHVGQRNFIRKFIAIALSLLFCQPTFAQSLENQQIVFEGSLTDISGNPIDLAGAQLTFYVSANGCYLYGETSNVSGDSQGNIVHRIGGGSQVTGSPNSFSQNIFFGTVTGTTSFASNNCTVLPAHTRLAQVYYAAQNISATIKLGTVPYAHNATMLNGKNAADFVEVSNDTNTLLYGGAAGQFLSKSASGSLTWINSSLTAAQISTALGYTPADVNGTLPAANLPSFSGDISTAAGSASATVQGLRGVTLAATAPVSGQILYYNGVAWSPMTIPSNVGTVTNVSSANSDINVAASTSAPLLTLNSGTGANQIVKLDASARLPSVDASQLTAINAANITSGTLPTGRLPSFNGDVTTVTGSSTVTVTKLRGFNISASAPATNQILAFVGGNWTPANAPTGSVTNVFAGTGLTGGPISSSGTLSVNFGTSSGSVAAGNDTRIVQALQSVNNLSDLTSSGSARANLGLGTLATKSIVALTSEVSGILPMANGGSKWSQSGGGGIYTASNTTVGSSTTFTNVSLYVTAPPVSNSVAASINNTNGDGFGLKINVDNTSSTFYGLRVSALNATNFIVRNDGNVGIGIGTPTAKLHLAGGNASLAPLKLASGSLMSTPAAGAIEFDGLRLFFTDDSGIRRTINTGIGSTAIDNISSINSTANISLNPTGSVVVSSTLASTNSGNGALIVNGGLGVNGAINANGSISTLGNLSGASVIATNYFGGTASGANLYLESTNHATKGDIVIAGNGGNVGIGVNPNYRFHVRSPAANTYVSVITPASGSSMMGIGEDSNNQLYSILFDATGSARNFFAASGTNYINNSLVIGAISEVPGNKLTIAGAAHVAGNFAVSKTVLLGGATTAAVPLQFINTVLSATLFPGAVEYDGTNLFYTNASSQRRRLAGGATSGTVDNVNKISYTGGNLVVEGSTTGTTPAVTINNLGAGTVALQINDSATVSGSIKLSSDGLDLTVTCTTADEGKQRYNKTLKVMEYCDGTFWQGMNGVTHCTTVSGGTSFTLVGKPGTSQAYCISMNNEPSAAYYTAANNCLNKATSTGARPSLCLEVEYQGACKQYSVFGALGEAKLPGLRSTAFWTPVPFSSPNYMLLAFNTGTANVCNITDQGVGQDNRDNNYSYRCCYH